MSCELPTSKLPGESAAGKKFAQGGDHPSPPSLTPHFARLRRNVSALPAPLQLSSPPQASEPTTSATFFNRRFRWCSWAQSAAPQTVAVLLDRHHPHSASVLCEHPAASRTSGAGSRSLRKPGSRRCRERRTAIRASEPSRLSPVRPSVHPSRPVSSAPLLRPDGLRSIPLQSPAAPTTPDHLPGHAPLRSASYGTARLLAATRNPLAHSPGD